MLFVLRLTRTREGCKPPLNRNDQVGLSEVGMHCGSFDSSWHGASTYG